MAEQKDGDHDDDGDADTQTDHHELVHLRLFHAWQKICVKWNKQAFIVVGKIRSDIHIFKKSQVLFLTHIFRKN